MTGIERLRKLIEDYRTGHECDGFECTELSCGKCMAKNVLKPIADQIEREQGEHVSRMRVLAVVTDMERHVSGVEGMEDSPVARWARELREALGGNGRDHAADGKPLREGEHVYHVETGAELVVKGLPKPGEYQAVVVFALPTSPASHLTSFDPDQLTHQRPDTWQRIEEDAGCTATKYNERRGTIFTTKQQVARDLVRRAKALAERERGE